MELKLIGLAPPSRSRNMRPVATCQVKMSKTEWVASASPSGEEALVGLGYEVKKANNRLFELLLFGKVVVGVDADHEGDTLRGVRCGAGSERNQAENQDGNENPSHCSLPGERRRAVSDTIPSH